MTSRRAVVGDVPPSLVASFNKDSGKPLTIGIVGNGFVGGATRLFSCKSVSVLIYDTDPSKCVPSSTTLVRLAKECDIIFICVPTPMDTDGSCYTRIVRNVVTDLLEEADPRETTVVVRSTVPPGTCRELGVAFMPEFLTEGNWQEDFKCTKDWIVGADDPSTLYGYEATVMKETFISKLQRLLTFAVQSGNIKSDNMTVTNTQEAEMCKYVRNCFLATKVGFFNEIHHACRLANIDYGMVRTLVVRDERIGSSHTAVPGPDGKLGFGGTCLPKDTNAMIQFMLSKNKRICEEGVDFPRAYTHYPCKILGAVRDRNDTVDRTCRDWAKDTGRSTV